jgi:hypothetical protein
MTTVEINGDLFDEETGEYAGPARLDVFPTEVSDEETYLWVMRKFMEAEAEVKTEELKYNAVLENVYKTIQSKKSKVNWLRNRYEALVTQYVWNQLPRDSDGNLKRKSTTCPWGTVTFRTTQPRLIIQDEDKVVQWAERNWPSMLKVTTTPQVSKLSKELVDELMAKRTDAEKIGFNVLDGAQVSKVSVNL